jgi:hypothetical protein
MEINEAMIAIEEWYNNLSTYTDRFPARGTVGGALVVLNRLQETFDLDINAHTAKGGSQIIGASGPALKNLLTRFGETRPFLSEGGRTNRGLRGDIEALLNRLGSTDLAGMPTNERNETLIDLQRFLIGKVQEYHGRQRLKAEYNSTRSSRLLIRDLLDLARLNGKEGSVAQHLVGAKLQLRFPNHKIGIESVSTADQQLGRAGDFLVGTTAFHVTIAPMQPVYDKCKRNLQDGIRACLLVPEERLQGARQLAEMNGLIDQIDVDPIETYVGTNIAEQSEYDSDQLAHGFLRLFDEYNRRVEIAEIDKSLLIEIPANLQRLRHAAPGA